MLSEDIRLYRPGDDQDRWLFEGENGNPPHHNTIRHAWRIARNHARNVIGEVWSLAEYPEESLGRATWREMFHEAGKPRTARRACPTVPRFAVPTAAALGVDL
ncbi:MAG: hypothetical protein GEV07_06140 [Streptosporangiales bacterium]|nr:hypothetical protein [Streptosporangiales bacterium]